MIFKFTIILVTCSIFQVAIAQDAFAVPSFPSSIKLPHEACPRTDPQGDLERLEKIQEAVRDVNSLLPQLPPEEDAYIRAENKHIYDLFMQSKFDISKRASAALKRRPLFLAWNIRDDAARVQREIAMQHGYENARKLTPNVDALAAQQSLELLYRVVGLDKSVRNNLQKAARGMDENDMNEIVRKTELSILYVNAFIGCKISRAFYSQKVGAEKK
jgi:hypothetical protein